MSRSAWGHSSNNVDIRYWLDRIDDPSGRRVRKPRTNREAAEFWAAHILTSKSTAHLGEYVNSIDVSRDTIYSFGRHYPMGKIIRDANGRCVRVVLNTDAYPHRGFADTPGDQWNVHVLAEAAVSMATWKIKLDKVPLTSYRIGHGIRVRTHDDPEPDEYPQTSIPPLFTAWNPGPEPVQDRSNCIAGRTEEYSYEKTWYDFSTDRPATAHPRPSFTDRNGVTRFEYVGAANGTLVWVDADQDWQYRQEHPEHAGKEFFIIQCPCCRKHRAKHREWRERMDGYGWGRFARRGWRLYSEMIERYGDRDGWRQARREDVRAWREARKLRKEWEYRNYIPLEAVSRDKFGVPILRDGFAMRKDSDAYFKRERQRVRDERRSEKEMRKFLRERARIEAFSARMQAARKRRRERSFFGTTERITANLRAMRGLESDNNEPGGSPS